MLYSPSSQVPRWNKSSPSNWLNIVTELLMTIPARQSTTKTVYKTTLPSTDQRLSSLTLITDAKLKSLNMKVSLFKRETWSSLPVERTPAHGNNGRSHTTTTHSTTIFSSPVLITTCHSSHLQDTCNKLLSSKHSPQVWLPIKSISTGDTKKLEASKLRSTSTNNQL